MSVSISFADVQRLLTECAPGHTLRLANHFRIVKFNGRVFPTLPKHQNIELGHVKKMVRHLFIDKNCAKRHGIIVN